MREQIEKLVSGELERCLARHGEFASNHEAVSVVKEEIEEAFEALDNVSDNWIEAWQLMRRNRTVDKGLIRQTKAQAIEAAAEAIQVAAMCDKWLMLLERGERND